MKNNRLKAEILAPASSFESVKAAYNAGADAIYIGGLKFGARAYAQNMSEDELLGAIDYAHLHDKKIYMTVNTLLKERELEEELYNYLLPYYEQGLDAVIVQDLGVMAFIKEAFPDIAIHASTQMAVTGEYMPEYLQNIGVERVVTARELSLEEIKAIHDRAPDIEIESFVHGALCMGYSGMCFFSSFLGERSGNRGRCAQACRLPYCLLEENKEAVKSLADKRYVLSPKDICTVSILPQIIESGVYSLKIEGRMKRTEYTAGVTAIYRKYLDMYLEKDISDYSVSEEDMNILAELYNRGGFSEGYYNMRNSKEMMSLDRPNHFGIYVGNVRRHNNKLVMQKVQDLKKEDVLEIRNEKLDKQTDVRYNEFVVDKDTVKGGQYVLPINIKHADKYDKMPVYRMKNTSLLAGINDKYVSADKKIPLNAKLFVAVNKPIELMVGLNDEESCGITEDERDEAYDNCVCVYGPVIEPARNQGATIEQIMKNLNKTGQTEFVFDKIDIELEENCFVPVKVINDLRRDAISVITDNCLKRYRRSIRDCNNADYNKKSCDNTGYNEIDCDNKQDSHKTQQFLFENKSESTGGLYVFVSLPEQIDVILEFEEVKGCYVDLNIFDLDSDCEFFDDIKNKFISSGTELYVSLPVILRKDSSEKIINNADWLLDGIAGVLVHNVEQLAFMNRLIRDGVVKDLKIVSDYMLYAFNKRAVRFLHDNNVARYTMPVELTQNELIRLNQDKSVCSELVFYGYLPMMFTAQCQRKNSGKCLKRQSGMYLKDRKGKNLYVRMNCNYCYNTIYNSAPFSLFGMNENVRKIMPDVLRLHFTKENPEEIRRIITVFTEQFYNDDFSESTDDIFSEFTRGHFKRGVE